MIEVHDKLDLVRCQREFPFLSFAEWPYFPFVFGQFDEFFDFFKVDSDVILNRTKFQVFSEILESLDCSFIRKTYRWFQRIIGDSATGVSNIFMFAYHVGKKVIEKLLIKSIEGNLVVFSFFEFRECYFKVIIALDRSIISRDQAFVVNEFRPIARASSIFFRAATRGFSNCFSSHSTEGFSPYFSL
jgi:hypothetical protein